MTNEVRVDLNLLRVFHAILEENSLTLAGNRLGLSQPAVSYALGRLRAMFDDPLFVRSGNEMVPTSAAMAMREAVQHAMVAAHDVLRFTAPFDAARSSRTFRLALSDIGSLVFLPKLCDRLAVLAPEIKLEVVSLSLPQVQEALRNGQLDLAIGNLPGLRDSTHFTSLFREDHVCMTRWRAGLPGPALPLSHFLALSHLQVTSTESGHQQVEDHFIEHGIQRKIVLRVPHFTVVPEILARTDWIVTVPRRIAPALNRSDAFTIYELPVKTPEITITAHWHENFESNDANRWLRALVSDTLREDHENGMADGMNSG
ncbi:LysR family transcriptional regulator [Paraburkholderia bonniea]|uniref:LysR family transcriptional regulator n=1 Tax=Paraburkholderia bonniea TaxID=2152891 RepID=UPI0012912189|nr:LysR family transcriptional regulator [Paraburkholderia bonniea]WJF90829.1 LysR family transcriptional regulator [Paraburkholderia bonniea]WJF94143.1 LysR family transcriptional regulator [Paraburkholderia bonniea]